MAQGFIAMQQSLGAMTQILTQLIAELEKENSYEVVL
ncbi:hypothetical protein COLO4_37827 [Corchorus olitorius]|uniref:Uncharacterized protein n=1 Tax=Corchorus olitorius TaxID=93759 RepID=A0A1R3FYY8_9ROSI|nr:hypothetical protein COLO4_37827 [Corchorus olitorius]